MTDAVVTGLLAGYGIAIPVGAIAALLVSLTARTSFRVGAAAALGVATADGLYALIAVLGGVALARVIEPLATPLRWAAGVILLWLAIRTAAYAVRHHRETSRVNGREGGMATPARAFLGLTGLTLLNPTTIVYFGALVLGRQTAGHTSPTEAGFVLAVFVASASWQLLLATGGALIGRVLTGPRGRLITALVSSLVIGSLAVHVLLSD